MKENNLPSHFLPKLTTNYQRYFTKKITQAVLRINSNTTNIERAKTEIERIEAYFCIHYDFIGIQNILLKLTNSTDDKKTSTLVSSIWTELDELKAPMYYLRANNTNYQLIKSIANNISGLLYNFKKSNYKRLFETINELKQTID